MREAGVPPSSALRHDAQYLSRGAKYDGLFPAEKIETSARAVCASMGLDLQAEGRVRLDIEDRPLKSPRAFCASLRVPEEVYLVIRPRGGYDDYSAFWHELGHALHFAGVAADAPFEWKRLGDNSVTEGFRHAVRSSAARAALAGRRPGRGGLGLRGVSGASRALRTLHAEALCGEDRL